VVSLPLPLSFTCYNAQKLYANLTALERKGLEEISKKQLEVDRLLSAVQVFKKFATELRDNGTAVVVVSE